jgi:hypothetical protein
VHPRVLEPLISLTLSTEQIDLEIAKTYIKELVNLIAYPNIRVQFQSAWGLANLALGKLFSFFRYFLKSMMMPESKFTKREGHKNCSSGISIWKRLFS